MYIFVTTNTKFVWSNYLFGWRNILHLNFDNDMHVEIVCQLGYLRRAKLCHHFLFDTVLMPKLSIRQREQAIWRLNDGQRPEVVANAFNYNERIITWTIECHNSTNDHNVVVAPSKTQRHDFYILPQHLQYRFHCTTQNKDQLVIIQSNFGWLPWSEFSSSLSWTQIVGHLSTN